jgi:uncharacterized protein
MTFTLPTLTAVGGDHSGPFLSLFQPAPELAEATDRSPVWSESPCATALPGARLRLTHGPIDLILSADGARDDAFRAAMRVFPAILPTLCAELPLLRRAAGPRPAGAVAARMHDACRAPREAGIFVTPMAAVAGAVAELVLQAMLSAGPLTRAIVNNGGDIAIHLAPGSDSRIAIAAPDGRPLGLIRVGADDPVRGIATSGWRGRSHSLGIADAVTVLAVAAPEADVAATLIANAVDLPGDPAIRRTRARDLAPDSDLGDRPVTTGVGPLSRDAIALALCRGAKEAQRMRARGQIVAAALFLQGQSCLIGPDGFRLEPAATEQGALRHA